MGLLLMRVITWLRAAPKRFQLAAARACSKMSARSPRMSARSGFVPQGETTFILRCNSLMLHSCGRFGLIFFARWWKQSNKKSIMEGKLRGNYNIQPGIQYTFTWLWNSVGRVIRTRLMNISADYAWRILVTRKRSPRTMNKKSSVILHSPGFCSVEIPPESSKTWWFNIAYLRWCVVDPHL